MAALGRAIVRRREALGWTQNRLAVRADLAGPYLRRVEEGDTKRIGVEVVAKIAAALRTTVDDLLAEAGLPMSGGQSSALASLYGDLGPIERRALYRMGEALRDLQQDYAALQEPPEELTGEYFHRLAAFPYQEMIDRLLRERRYDDDQDVEPFADDSPMQDDDGPMQDLDDTL